MDKGWRYFFIEGYGVILAELDIHSLPFTYQAKEHLRGGFINTLSVDFGRSIPKPRLKSIINLERFIINIRNQDYSRAITIDIAKNEITYIHDLLWICKGEDCMKEAEGVFRILEWLVEEKKLRLPNGEDEKYRELTILFAGK